MTIANDRTITKQWIVQKCVEAMTKQYENWPGYCETPVTQDEVFKLLKECDEKWPEFEFRGHNINAFNK